MKSPEQIAAEANVRDMMEKIAAANSILEQANAAAAAANEGAGVESFRTTVEKQLAECYSRLKTLEAGGAAGLDSQGNSLEGKIRTFEGRILAVETVQAENTSSLLRMADVVSAQAGRIAALEAAPKPAQ